jgi:hypothetical protein
MSRSRRKSKTQKCICGKLFTKYKDFVQHRRQAVADCTVLAYVEEHNEQFMKYREQRSLPPNEED